MGTTRHQQQSQSDQCYWAWASGGWKASTETASLPYQCGNRFGFVWESVTLGGLYHRRRSSSTRTTPGESAAILLVTYSLINSYTLFFSFLELHYLIDLKFVGQLINRLVPHLSRITMAWVEDRLGHDCNAYLRHPLGWTCHWWEGINEFLLPQLHKHGDRPEPGVFCSMEAEDQWNWLSLTYCHQIERTDQ